MNIILTHLSWPSADETHSTTLHKPKMFIDLSGWPPKYFPAQVIHYANTHLGNKMLFGPEFPWSTPEKWVAACDEAGFREPVKQASLQTNLLTLLFPEFPKKIQCHGSPLISQRDQRWSKTFCLDAAPLVCGQYFNPRTKT